MIQNNNVMLSTEDSNKLILCIKYTIWKLVRHVYEGVSNSFTNHKRSQNVYFDMGSFKIKTSFYIITVQSIRICVSLNQKWNRLLFYRPTSSRTKVNSATHFPAARDAGFIIKLGKVGCVSHVYLGIACV